MLNNNLITGASDNTIKIWDLLNKSCAQTLFGHNGPVTCLKINDDILASGSYDNTVKVWNLNYLLISRLDAAKRPAWSEEHFFQDKLKWMHL